MITPKIGDKIIFRPQGLHGGALPATITSLPGVENQAEGTRPVCVEVRDADGEIIADYNGPYVLTMHPEREVNLQFCHWAVVEVSKYNMETHAAAAQAVADAAVRAEVIKTEPLIPSAPVIAKEPVIEDTIPAAPSKPVVEFSIPVTE